MEKNTYYVTMDGTIRTVCDENDAHYDFEIEATKEEVEELQRLFQLAHDQDFSIFLHAQLPYYTEDRMQENRGADRIINEIYQKIYLLGSEETKRSMKQSGLIPASSDSSR